MNEPELVEAANSTFALVVDLLTFYMTITSAYLIVAYIVGAKLSRFQVTVVSVLYVFMGSASTYALSLWTMRGIYYMAKVQALDAAAPINPTPIIPVMIIAALIGGVVTSLVFMWNIRRNSKSV